MMRFITTSAMTVLLASSVLASTGDPLVDSVDQSPSRKYVKVQANQPVNYVFANYDPASSDLLDPIGVDAMLSNVKAGGEFVDVSVERKVPSSIMPCPSADSVWGFSIRLNSDGVEKVFQGADTGSYPGNPFVLVNKDDSSSYFTMRWGPGFQSGIDPVFLQDSLRSALVSGPMGPARFEPMLGMDNNGIAAISVDPTVAAGPYSLRMWAGSNNFEILKDGAVVDAGPAMAPGLGAYRVGRFIVTTSEAFDQMREIQNLMFEVHELVE